MEGIVKGSVKRPLPRDSTDRKRPLPRDFTLPIANVLSPVTLHYRSHLPVSAALSLHTGCSWARTKQQGKR